jgi:hypothetical protein
LLCSGQRGEKGEMPLDDKDSLGMDRSSCHSPLISLSIKALSALHPARWSLEKLAPLPSGLAFCQLLSPKLLFIYYLLFIIIIVIITVLRFELRVLYLLGRCSTT